MPQKLGKGSEISVMAPLWGTSPGEGNAYWTAMDTAADVKVKWQNQDGNVYGQKLGAVLASSSIPDAVVVPGWTYDHRHLSHLYPVWPLDAINPYGTPELATAAYRALELRGSENDSAHGHLHHALIAARLRDPSRVSAALDAVLGGDFFHDSLMSARYPSRNVYNADAAHSLPTAVIESLVQSSPGRLVLLPAVPVAYPAGELLGVRTRFGAHLDLRWSKNGATAVLRPTRDAQVDLRTGDGLALTGTSAGNPPAPLELTADVDRVITLGPR